MNNKNDDYRQDIIIYEDLPVIAFKTKRIKKDDHDDNCSWFNNETFKVVNIDIKNKMITLHTIRPDGEVNLKLSTEMFNTYFVMNYCSTVHKSQGDTIDEPFNIYEYSLMSEKMRYTAITRATKIENIGVNA